MQQKPGGVRNTCSVYDSAMAVFYTYQGNQNEVMSVHTAKTMGMTHATKTDFNRRLKNVLNLLPLIPRGLKRILKYPVLAGFCLLGKAISMNCCMKTGMPDLVLRPDQDEKKNVRLA